MRYHIMIGMEISSLRLSVNTAIRKKNGLTPLSVRYGENFPSHESTSGSNNV